MKLLLGVQYQIGELERSEAQRLGYWWPEENQTVLEELLRKH